MKLYKKTKRYFFEIGSGDYQRISSNSYELVLRGLGTIPGHG